MRDILINQWWKDFLLSQFRQEFNLLQGNFLLLQRLHFLLYWPIGIIKEKTCFRVKKSWQKWNLVLWKIHILDQDRMSLFQIQEIPLYLLDLETMSLEKMSQIDLELSLPKLRIKALLMVNYMLDLMKVFKEKLYTLSNQHVVQ